MDNIACGKEVLAIEIEGLTKLKDSLGNEFDRAVEMICNGSGKVVMTGIGKSGHIARKIAATLSSTGTTSIFIHPTEASHGDLGMIAEGDVVVILSNSGETQELKDLIAYCKRFAIKMIGMTRGEDSTLHQIADICLLVPNTVEAASIGAPTTSTTQMLALGDAIAVAVLSHKKFSKDKFGILHPGGKIGSQFLIVRDYMHKGEKLPICYENTLMPEVLIEMSKKGFGCALVVDKEHRLLGIVTDGDLRRHMSPDLLTKVASEVMTKRPSCVLPETLIAEVLGIMNSKSITSMIVCNEKGVLEGLIHIHDCLRLGVA